MLTLTDAFDFLYFKTHYKFLHILRLNSFCRYALRKLANLILPIVYNLTKSNKKYRLELSSNNSKRIIISLTSYPVRISKVWLVIETLLRQSVKPDMIILWLSKQQFSSLEALPFNLLNQQKRGLKIILCEDDLKSHKKYYYTYLHYPNDTFITVDDDVFYNTKLVEQLIIFHKKYPNSIVCNYAVEVSYKNNEPEFYYMWKRVKSPVASLNIVPIGVGGVLYPPGSLHNKVLDVYAIKEYAFTTDDLWLNAMSRVMDKGIIYTGFQSLYLPILQTNNTHLHTTNNVCHMNDVSLRKIRCYCLETLGIDPYKYKNE